MSPPPKSFVSLRCSLQLITPCFYSRFHLLFLRIHSRYPWKSRSRRKNGSGWTSNQAEIWSGMIVLPASNCARLDVPLDWLAHSDEARVVPAIIKLLATDLKYYKGPVFINPGGPGGSGIWSLKRSGKAFQRSQEQVTISSVLILEAVSRLVHVKRRNIS